MPNISQVCDIGGQWVVFFLNFIPHLIISEFHFSFNNKKYATNISYFVSSKRGLHLMKSEGENQLMQQKYPPPCSLNLIVMRAAVTGWSKDLPPVMIYYICKYHRLCVWSPCSAPISVVRVHPLSKKCNMPPIWSFHLKHSFLAVTVVFQVTSLESKSGLYYEHTVKCPVYRSTGEWVPVRHSEGLCWLCCPLRLN